MPEVALLNRDETVKCIEDRARSFQGWRPHTYIERFRIQRYGPSGYYVHHYDCSGGCRRRAERTSTFMVYVAANCTSGGTESPRLKKPADAKWCESIECEEETGDDDGPVTKSNVHGLGIAFKPIAGNAVYWENLRSDGSGYSETWHAGLPVTSGSKIGLNIWSWYQPPAR